VLGVRVLVASTRGAGHFGPLVPFIEGGLRAGHEVLVVGPPALADAVDAAGYPFRTGGAPPDEELGALWERVPAVPREEAEAIVIGGIFAGLNVAAMLPGLRRACAEWRPDIVLREQSEFASAIAAEVHGVPHARVAIGLALAEEESLRIAGPVLDERRPGLAARIRASPLLTTFPASLEDPAATGPPATHRFRDPAAAPSSEPLPDWWPGDRRPLVYVSFGSVAGTLPLAGPIYAAVMDAAAGLSARVLLTVGNETDLGVVGPAPPNVRVERWVPQARVLGRASAVVCHGGSGTTLGALAAGLPLVVVPLFADQPLNARRVAEVGAGVAIEHDEPTPVRVDPAALRAAIERVLAEPAYAAAARAIADEMAALPPAVEAVAALT
jgi:hypothetical protein